jgi:quinol monooxygenase YgiN
VSKFAVVMKIVAHEGKGPELEAVFDSIFRQVEGEPGTELYVLNRSAADPDVLWLYEVFSSKSDFDAHCDTDTVRAFGPQLARLVASREIVQGEPVRGRGLDV